MKHRVASWRYSRGPRVLAQALGHVVEQHRAEVVQEEEDYDDIPDEMEQASSVFELVISVTRIQ